MSKRCLFILFLFLAVLCVGCSSQHIKDQAKEHSQYVMDYACSDSVYREFSRKHFNIERLKGIMREFCETCPDYKNHGGFKNFQYYVFTSSENHIIYTYEYQCQPITADVKFHYALYEDRFELIGFKIEYITAK